MSETPVIRAGLYLRISSDRRDGEGVERQEEACRQLAASLGWTVTNIYRDNSISAWKTSSTGELRTRPEYQRMIDDIQTDHINGLIAWHSDRLHRSNRQFEDFLILADRKHLDIRCVTAGQIDLSTSTGRMNARNACTLAQYESDHRSERITAAKRQLAKTGRFLGGPRSYGYERGDQIASLRIVKREADEIKNMAAAVISGQSLRSLVKDLNDRGVPTTSGAHWTVPKIRRVLQSPRIAGLCDVDGDLITASWPAIIDMPTFEALKTLFSDPSRRSNPGQHTGRGRTPEALGTQLYICGGCNKPRIVRTGSRVKPMYDCHARQEGERGHISRRAEPIDRYVSGVMIRKMTEGRWVDEMCNATQLDNNPDLAGLAAERVRLAELRQAWRQKAKTGDVDPDTYTDIIDGLTARDYEISGILSDHAERSAYETVRNWIIDNPEKPVDELWHDMPIGQKRCLLAETLTVTLLSPGAGRRKFDEQTIKIELTDKAKAAERRVRLNATDIKMG